MHTTVEIIQREHRALAAMLRGVALLIDPHRPRDGSLPPFDTLRAMLFYIDEFPEQRHHRKETELLFPKLRARTPMHRDLLDRLDGEHHLGETRIRALERALTAWQTMGERRRAAFEEAANRFVAFYLEHMRLEEREILPLAQRVLRDADWAELDAAFAENRDGLAGAAAEVEYAALFERIEAALHALGVRLVPAHDGAPGA